MRLPHRQLDVERNAVGVLDGVGELAERGGDLYLALLLEAAHGVLVGGRGAADHDHRPAVLLRVGEFGEAMDDAGTRDREAGAGAPVR